MFAPDHVLCGHCSHAMQFFLQSDCNPESIQHIGTVYMQSNREDLCTLLFTAVDPSRT
jgi:hypothetical protein